LRHYDTFYSKYAFDQKIRTQQVSQFVYSLMRVNSDREVWVIRHNYRSDRSITAEYESKYRDELHSMLLPPYSPELNPQKDIWSWLKD
jgi:transposase